MYVCMYVFIPISIIDLSLILSTYLIIPENLVHH